MLGTNFFRVAGLESQFAAPPLCRHDPATPEPTETTGWTPKAAAAAEAARPVVWSAPAATTVEAAATVEESAAVAASGRHAVPSWLVVFVAVAGGAGLVGLTYIAGQKRGAKASAGRWAGYTGAWAGAWWPKAFVTAGAAGAAADEEGIPYRLQNGDAPLLAGDDK